MASKFLPGTKNVLEVLSQVWDAFAAGPCNALSLMGGWLCGVMLVCVLGGAGMLYQRMLGNAQGRAAVQAQAGLEDEQDTGQGGLVVNTRTPAFGGSKMCW